MSDLGPVTITAREIYDAVLRLSAKVDLVLVQLDEAKTDLGDHEARLRSLERNRWPLPSVALLISLLSFGLTFIIR